MANIDLSSLTSAMTAAVTLSNLVLVTPQKNVGYQPQDENGFAEGTTLLFHFEDEQMVNLESDITDHYVEDNTVVNDQIALKPEIVTVTGLIGELNNVSPSALSVLKIAAEKLTLVSAYTPELSVTALRVYNLAEQAYNTAALVKKNAVQLWKTLNKLDAGAATIGSTGLESGAVDESQTLQQIYFQQFYGHWRNRKLFTVQTPWAIFKNMAIQSLRAIQAEGTQVVTSFEITFKMLRFATTQLEQILYSENSSSGRAGQQKSSAVNLGTQRPTPSLSLTSLIA